MNSSGETAVERLLEKERAKALDNLANAGTSGAPIERAADLYSDLPSNVSNIPLGQGLFEQIILGRTPILDLQADEPSAFTKRHGLSIATVSALAEEGALVPNVYVTNPERWRDVDEELVKLLQHRSTVCTAKRAEVLLGEEFAANRQVIAESYRAATQGYTEADWVQLSTRVLRKPENDAKGILNGLSSRAARIKTAAPEVWANAIGEQVADGHGSGCLMQVVQHARRVRSANHIYTGAITASAGQTYLPGIEELELAKSVNFLSGRDDERRLHDALVAHSAEASWKDGTSFLVGELSIEVPAPGSDQDALMQALVYSKSFVRAREEFAAAIAAATHISDRALDEDKVRAVEQALAAYQSTVEKVCTGVKSMAASLSFLAAAATIAGWTSRLPSNHEQLATIFGSGLVAGTIGTAFRFLYRPQVRRLAASVAELKKLIHD